jgi:hypothetical protein
VLLAVKRAIWEHLAGEHDAVARPASPALATVGSGSRFGAVARHGSPPNL